MDLCPNWVVGFTDGKGCFSVGILPDPKNPTGYRVLPEFVIVQDKQDIQTLYALKRFFRCGVVRNQKDCFVYRVRDPKGLRKVCDFFLRHPLKTRKQVDFLRFNRIVTMIERGDHLRLEGLLEIIQVAARMKTSHRQPLIKEVVSELRQRLSGRMKR